MHRRHFYLFALLLAAVAPGAYATPAGEDQFAQLKQLTPSDSTIDVAGLKDVWTPEKAAILDDLLAKERAMRQKKADTAQPAANDLEESILDPIGIFDMRPPRRPLTDATTVEKIKDFGLFAGMSYCENLKKWECGAHCSNPRAEDTTIVAELDEGATRAFVARRNAHKQIVVSYRGTNNFENLVDDLNFDTVAYPYATLGQMGVDVHLGFLETYQRVRDQILQIVRDQVAQFPDHTVVFTGHSLGGAVCTISATDITTALGLDPAKVWLYSYAAPRSGNNAWANLVNSVGFVSHRVTVDDDVVPHLPPQEFGFLHPAQEHYIQNGITYTCLPNEDNECSNVHPPLTSVISHGRFYGQELYFGPFPCE